MRIFQILGEVCHWDASNVISSLDEAAERFAPDIWDELAAFGISENDYAQIVGVVGSVVSVVGYIFGESAVDAAREKNPDNGGK